MPSKKTKLKKATVIGVFATRSEAEAALRDLRAAGFTDDQLGLVARNASGQMVDEAGETYADEGAVAGVVAGAGVGALVGLGVLAGVIPVIGPAIAGGTLGVILTNAAGGAAALGIAGALIGWGIPEEDAKYYEAEVKAGRFLVTVEAADRKDEAWAILHKHGGYSKTQAAETAAKGGKRIARAAADSGATSGKTLQLKEEQLKVNKRRVSKGEVEVRKEVVTEQKTVTVPVEREEVVIERRPARGRATAAGGSLRAETIRVPVSEERVNVEKETVVTGEVRIGKRKVAGDRTVADAVRKEQLRVEGQGAVEVTGATETTTGTRRRK
ncbi:MAG: YsnF/AvaK domain-containing protein [Gemmataceae bacterium]|nr:YsnF/AvaK domain-containing protein [Gemmataceae bacterium]